MSSLVSAIMPIANRRDFFPGAAACFMSQDWTNRELVIVEDGDDDIRDLIPPGANVQYIRLPGLQSIGKKRNVACAHARGEYIVHWDSDDWYGPQRISEQVRILRQSSRPATGYNSMPFAWDEGRRAWLYLGQQGYACGTSLCYLRAYWAGHRFKDVQIGEDNEFLRSIGERFISVSGRSIVARIHGAATCPKIEKLTSTAWTGATGQTWQEIQYEQLAQCGYPIIPAVVCARAEEPADDRSGACGTGSGGEDDLRRRHRTRSDGSPRRARGTARAGRSDGIPAGRQDHESGHAD